MAHSESTTDDPANCPVCNQAPFTDSCFGCGWPAASRVDGARGLETVPDPVAPDLRDTYENADVAAAGEHGEPPVASTLRSMDSKADEALVEAGYQASNVGISVTQVSAWKRKRKHVTDTQLYDYLVRDAVVAHGYFWAAYHRHETLAGFVDAVLEDNAHGSSEENIARSYRWTTETIDAPAALSEHQTGLGRWS